MTQLFALFCNGHISSIESGPIQAQQRILQSARFGAMADWTKSHLNRYSQLSEQHAQWLEALVSVSNHMKSEHTLFDPAQQWRCTSPEYRSTPSCSSGDGRATLFCGTSGNKSNNSHNTLQSRCSRFDLFAQSQTSPRELYRTKIPDSAIIETTPRLGEILDVSRLDECSYQPSLFSTDRL